MNLLTFRQFQFWENILHEHFLTFRFFFWNPQFSYRKWRKRGIFAVKIFRLSAHTHPPSKKFQFSGIVSDYIRNHPENLKFSNFCCNTGIGNFSEHQNFSILFFCMWGKCQLVSGSIALSSLLLWSVSTTIVSNITGWCIIIRHIISTLINKFIKSKT